MNTQTASPASSQRQPGVFTNNNVLRALLTQIQQNVMPVNGIAGESREMLLLRQTLHDTLCESIGYTFQISTQAFPRPMKVAFIMRQIKEILHVMVAPKTLMDILIALEEVTANIIEHSYMPGEQGEIMFTFSFRFSRIKIEVDDFGERGRRYDFDKSGHFSSLEELHKTGVHKRGGMGVFMIRRVMDEVGYAVVPGQYNRITMVKYL